MKNVKSIALIAIAVVAASASSAPAGTKYASQPGVQQRRRSAAEPDPVDRRARSSSTTRDTSRSSLAGVTDGAGALVTTSTTLQPNQGHESALDGTEYIVIIKLVLPAISGLIPIVEVPVPVDLKAGKGKTKLDAGPLFALLPAGTGRTAEIIGTEVWGPLTVAKAPGCTAIVGSALPASLTSPDPTCRGTGQIGMSGLAIPLP